MELIIEDGKLQDCRLEDVPVKGCFLFHGEGPLMKVHRKRKNQPNCVILHDGVLDNINPQEIVTPVRAKLTTYREVG